MGVEVTPKVSVGDRVQFVAGPNLGRTGKVTRLWKADEPAGAVVVQIDNPGPAPGTALWSGTAPTNRVHCDPCYLVKR
jgi:hypothetical protein